MKGIKVLSLVLLFTLRGLWILCADNPVTLEKDDGGWKLVIPKTVLYLALIVIGQGLLK